MRRYLIAALILAGAALAGWLLRPKPALLERATVGERQATLWSRLAAVREPVAQLKYGQTVYVLERKINPAFNAEYVRVRTEQGAEGWLDARHLMTPEVLEKGRALLERTRSLPRQASGTTKVLTNVRVEPGRGSARLFQWGKGVKLEIFARAVAERPHAEESSGEVTPAEGAAAPPRREDWLLVRGRDEQAGEIAGWVRGSFLEPELPEALAQYAQGIRFVAWFELSRVQDIPPPVKDRGRAAAAKREESGGESEPVAPREMPQYLAAGVTGPEGGECDFTLLRYYTWDAPRRRYATAYVESHFCGRFPILAEPVPAGANPNTAEAKFSFAAIEKGAEVRREYRVKQNIVRPVRRR
jgi:hypothetical protein